MTALWSDIRFAVRSLRKAPMFTFVAVVSLALGIGANSAIFSLLDQVLLRLLPVKKPQELALLTMRGQHYGNNWGMNAISYPMYRDFQDHNEVFTDMFARFSFSPSFTVESSTDRVRGEMVSGTYFPAMGVGAVIGRVFTPDDDRTPSGHPLAVLSYRFWETRFGKDRNVLGKKVLVNNIPLTIVGVAQPGFDGIDIGNSAQIFVPLMMEPDLMPSNKDFLKTRRTRWVNTFGRLKHGISLQQAKASLQPYMHSMLEMEVLEPAFRNASDIVRQQFLQCYMDVLPGGQGRSYIRQRLQAPLWVLMALAATVLLIACVNLANLLLARAPGRAREVAIRLAIGSGRWRIVRQLLTESLLLSTVSGVCALGLAVAADKLLLAAFVPSDSPGVNVSASLDLRVLVFTFSLTVVTGLLFGLFPAVSTVKPEIAGALKDQAGSVIGGGNVRLRKILVAAQVMLSLVLLLGAGLFWKSLGNLRNLGPGFPVERLVAFELNPALVGYSTERSKQFFQSLTENLQAVPRVGSVGVAAVRILEDNESDSWMTIEGYTPRPGDRPDAYMNWIGPNYFATMGVPVVAGRDFTTQDRQEALHREPDFWVPTKVIVNESFVKRYFGGRNALGRHIGYGIDPGTKTDMEIIGVVKDVKYTNLRDEIPDQAFLPYLGVRNPFGMTVFVRTVSEPSTMFNVIRSTVHEMDAGLPITGMRTIAEDINDSLITERMTADLSAVFGALAVLTTIIGLYGVMAYSVARRTREIGIRMALGAVQGSVIWMVMKEVVLLVGVGVAAALPAAFGLTQFVRAQLFGVTPHDPSTIALATLALMAIACAAGYVPALRASRVDPIRALRYE